MRRKQAAIKEALQHSWKGYVDYAWGMDELTPLTKAGREAVISVDLCASSMSGDCLRMHSCLPESPVALHYQVCKEVRQVISVGCGQHKHPRCMTAASVAGKQSFGGLGATLVDSLDTLWLMGLKDEFQKARDWIVNELNFNRSAAADACCSWL